MEVYQEILMIIWSGSMFPQLVSQIQALPPLSSFRCRAPPLHLMASRVPNHNLPTITCMLAQEQYSYLRLPAYRVSHRLRYHPYPRYAPPSQDDSLMTIPLAATGSSLPTVIEEDLEIAMFGPTISARQTESHNPRARRLSALVVELAFVVRRNLASTRAKMAKHNVADGAEAGNQEA